MADHTPEQSDLRSFLRVLRRRAALILLCVAAMVGGALALSLTQQKKYEASAQLLFRTPGFDQSVNGTPFFAPGSDPRREAETNEKLVSLRAVRDRTSRRLGSSVTSEIDISQQGQSDIVAITVTDPDPDRAALVANVFAEEYIAFRRDADRAKVLQARDLSQRQLDTMPPAIRAERGRALKERIEQLGTIAALQTGNAELVQRAAAPSSPSSPRPVRNGILAGALGLLFGIGLALLIERLDRRVRDPKELESLFDRPILAAIPASKALAKAGPAPASLPPEEGEAFRMLRANLRYFNVDDQIRSVLITSAAPGEGKSTVACNLASAAAEAGQRVLLLEADLRRPSIASALGLSPSRGLTHVLAGDSSVQEAVHGVRSRHSANSHTPSRMFDVLVCGPLPPNPTDLIESERMRSVIKAAAAEYDLVVIDTPPTTVVSDAVPLIAEVDGVIVVGRLNQSTGDAAAHLRTQLAHLQAPLLGVVVNDLGRDATGYGYGTYGYGYGAALSRDKPTVSAAGLEVVAPTNAHDSNGTTPADDEEAPASGDGRAATADALSLAHVEAGPAVEPAEQREASGAAPVRPVVRRGGGLFGRLSRRPKR